MLKAGLRRVLLPVGAVLDVFKQADPTWLPIEHLAALSALTRLFEAKVAKS